MNRKLKTILNSLEVSPEIKEKKCTTKVRQLRSAYACFEADSGLKVDTLKKRITRLCISLQGQVSDPDLKKGIRTIQRESDKLYNGMMDPGGIDYSLCWCKDDE